MVDKPSETDGHALWQRVIATVRPLGGRGRRLVEVVPSADKPSRNRVRAAPTVAKAPASQSKPGETLDGVWDRRLQRGGVLPDMTVDLHGHTLAAAHAALDNGLAIALARHARVILLVTGRPPREGTDRIDGRPLRGAIRASVHDWLASSRHAGSIAAIRPAHPRHGGAGALYIILRRRRTPGG